MFARRKPAIVVPLDVVEPLVLSTGGEYVHVDIEHNPFVCETGEDVDDGAQVRHVHVPEWVQRARAQALPFRVEGGSARS